MSYELLASFKHVAVLLPHPPIAVCCYICLHFFFSLYLLIYISFIVLVLLFHPFCCNSASWNHCVGMRVECSIERLAHFGVFSLYKHKLYKYSLEF